MDERQAAGALPEVAMPAMVQDLAVEIGPQGKGDEPGACTAADDGSNSSEAGITAGSVISSSRFSSFQQEPYREVP